MSKGQSGIYQELCIIQDPAHYCSFPLCIFQISYSAIKLFHFNSYLFLRAKLQISLYFQTKKKNKDAKQGNIILIAFVGYLTDLISKVQEKFKK